MTEPDPRASWPSVQRLRTERRIGATLRSAAAWVRGLAGLGSTGWFLVLLAGAIGLRVWMLTRPDLGHLGDLDIFTRWMRGLHQHGLRDFYANEGFCDYPPITLLSMHATGSTVFAFVSNPSDHLLRMAVKALACLGDVAIGLMLFREGRGLLGARAGVLAGGLYLLNPVSLYDSAFWGQVDSLYTAFLLGSLLLVRRGRWAGAGVLGGLALATKFQSIAILPLVVFEAWRIGRGRGLLRTFAGGTAAILVVAVPFATTGTLTEVVDRAYVNVVGQYHSLSKNAYNLWQLADDPSRTDTVPPQVVLNAAAGGEPVVAAQGSWLMQLTFRRISLVLFALSVAAVLSLYALRPSHIARYGAAGLLALCFYLFPTEMHERYAYPAIAFLAVWAAARPVYERLYWALTLAVVLNLAAVLPVHPLASQIAAVNLALFAAILVGIVISRPTPADATDASTTPVPVATGIPAGAAPSTAEAASSAAEQPGSIRLFQRATVLAAIGAAVMTGFVVWKGTTAARSPTMLQAIWLSRQVPLEVEQDYKRPQADRAVEGGLLRIDDRIYLRGIGSHAPATLVYAIPEEGTTFDAVLGIDHASEGKGSAIVRIEVDGDERFRSEVLTPEVGALPVRVDVSDGRTLTIRIDATEDGRKSDHVDLALARFVTAR